MSYVNLKDKDGLQITKEDAERLRAFHCNRRINLMVYSGLPEGVEAKGWNPLARTLNGVPEMELRADREPAKPVVTSVYTVHAPLSGLTRTALDAERNGRLAWMPGVKP